MVFLSLLASYCNIDFLLNGTALVILAGFAFLVLLSFVHFLRVGKYSLHYIEADFFDLTLTSYLSKQI